MKVWSTQVNVRLEWHGWPTNRNPKVFMEVPASDEIAYTLEETGTQAISRFIMSLSYSIQINSFLMVIIVYKNETHDEYDVRFDGESINTWFTDESLAKIFNSTDEYGEAEEEGY